MFLGSGSALSEEVIASSIQNLCECDSEGKFHLIFLTPSSSSFSENTNVEGIQRDVASVFFFYVMKNLDEKCPRQRGKEHLDACTAFKNVCNEMKSKLLLYPFVFYSFSQ